MKVPLTAIPAICFGLGVAACATVRSAPLASAPDAMTMTAEPATHACRAEPGPALVRRPLADDSSLHALLRKERHAQA